MTHGRVQGASCRPRLWHLQVHRAVLMHGVPGKAKTQHPCRPYALTILRQDVIGLDNHVQEWPGGKELWELCHGPSVRSGGCVPAGPHHQEQPC